jgi:hypothetical protein
LSEWYSTAGQRDRREQRFVVRLEQERQADARDDDADVLDRRVREQAFHVRLHGGEDHTEERSRQAEGERDDAPPPDLRMEEIEHDAQEPVDRGLEHHAAHQRRHRRWCRRVRLGSQT